MIAVHSLLHRPASVADSMLSDGSWGSGLGTRLNSSAMVAVVVIVIIVLHITLLPLPTYGMMHPRWKRGGPARLPLNCIACDVSRRNLDFYIH